jgi:segregation and condensation protein B
MSDQALDPQTLKPAIEGALLAAGRPLLLDELCDLFVPSDLPPEDQQAGRNAVRRLVRKALDLLKSDCGERGIELVEVASGYRFQVKQEVARQVSHLWATRPTRYSRALLETLALIAYRQPITRSEIEDVRGVSVSPQIVASLLEYGWVRVIGHRNTPGRPKLFGTTKSFLDQFGLRGLQDLPPLSEIKELQLPGGTENVQEGELIEAAPALPEGSETPALPAPAEETALALPAPEEIPQIIAAPLETAPVEQATEAAAVPVEMIPEAESVEATPQAAPDSDSLPSESLTPTEAPHEPL